MNKVYNFDISIIKDMPRNMSGSELASFLQKKYEETKETYCNDYLQSLDAIIFLYTGIHLYEIINKKQEIVADLAPIESKDTIEPIKTELKIDENYEKLLGYE